MKSWLHSLPSPFSLALRLGVRGGLAESAESAALTWLALVDAGNYPESWNTAAAYFRNAVPQAGWVSKVGAVRGPLAL